MNLIEGLLKEIDRCNELASLYESIGPAGVFGLGFIKADIEAAKKAMSSGDTVQMLRCYKKLHEYER
jgi:hypothetical protein